MHPQHNTLLPIFLILIPFSCLLSTSSSQKYLNCLPKPFTCGDFQTNISYPFRVDSRHDYCGYPGFYLNCTNNNTTLTITMNGTLYIVKNLDYFNHILTILDADFSGHPCPLTYTNTTINTSMVENYDRTQILTLHINCTSPPALVPVPSSLMDIPCLFQETGKHSYYSLESGVGFQAFPGKYCASTAMITVNLAAAERLSKSPMAFGEVLQEGLTVKWIAGRGWCSLCINSGGVCGYDGNNPGDQTCYCPYGSTTGLCYTGPVKRRMNKIMIIGSVSGVGVILLISCLWSLCYCKKRQKHTSSNLPSAFCWHERTSEDKTIEAFLQKHGTLPPKRYRYLEVKRMTESFHHKLGEGGFGSVYKGALTDGRAVAVKLLNNTNGDGEEFLNEVASIGRTSHINIISLLGFCFQGSKRALIYDFMSNGSLEKYIYAEDPKTILGWEKLFQIAIGIARGLEYLHRGCNTRIVHFDIKPHNILLDEDFCPKISDFGLAKLGTHKESILSMAGARGTVGFIAPEVFSRNFGVVSTKSDVYSYGMMLLEMAGGRRNVKVIVDRTSEIYFPHWIYDHLDQDEWLQYCKVTLDEQEMARKLIIVGLWCMQTRPECRPTMSQVVEMLQGSITDLKIPPKPYLSSPPRSPPTHSMVSDKSLEAHYKSNSNHSPLSL